MDQPAHRFQLRLRALLASMALVAWAALVALTAPFARADPAGEDLGAVFGGTEEIALATGYERPIFDAPTTATVVTRDEILRAGYTTLADVLAHAPGFHVSTSDGRTTKLIARGITSRVLLMLDGIPLFQGYLNGNLGLNNVLLHDVERIEIGLGPGSALYGADAVTGTINVISRTRGDAPLSEVGAFGGSPDTLGAWTLMSGDVGDAHLAFYGAFARDAGVDRTMAADAQTSLDRALGTHASLAPGRINADRKILDGRLVGRYGDFGARLLHHREYDFGTGVGFAQALDPHGTFNVKQSSFEVWHARTFESWETRAQLTYMDVTQWADVTAYPAGAFRNAFPAGVFQSFDLNERRARFDGSATYSGFTSHKLHFLLGALQADYDTVRESRNYTVARGRVLPTGSMSLNGGPGGVPVLSDSARDVLYAAAQDEWQLVRDLTLTAGFRVDRYSDVGTTTNPRASLVWSPSVRTSVKLMHGTAFRPPSLTELESNGVYSALGNASLRPSTLRMTEAVFNYRRAAFDTSIRAFRYAQRDLVATVPTRASPSGVQYVNSAADDGYGGEVVVRAELSPTLSLQTYGLYQRHTGAFRNSNLALAPQRQAQLSLGWTPSNYWSTQLSATGVFQRGRAAGDTRPPPDDYTLVDFSLRRRALFQGVEAALNIGNVFDERVLAGSESMTALPADVPMAGRRIVATLTYGF